jgi:cytochrome P450
MARSMLEDDAALPSEQSELDMIKDIAGITYLAGSDTTVAAVFSFFLAMLIYPDVQAKAQAEVERVVGKDRLPELDDAPHMPYVQGVVNECLRWLPVVPMCKLLFSFPPLHIVRLFAVLNSRSARHYSRRRV